MTTHPCCHPRSCPACERTGQPCGAHHAGTPGHERCTGTPVKTRTPAVTYHTTEGDLTVTWDRPTWVVTDADGVETRLPSVPAWIAHVTAAHGGSWPVPSTSA